MPLIQSEVIRCWSVPYSKLFITFSLLNWSGGDFICPLIANSREQSYEETDGRSTGSKNPWGFRLTDHLNLVHKLRFSGAIPPLSLYFIMVCVGKILLSFTDLYTI